jgi:hypothetical protein
MLFKVFLLAIDPVELHAKSIIVFLLQLRFFALNAFYYFLELFVNALHVVDLPLLHFLGQLETLLQKDFSAITHPVQGLDNHIATFFEDVG